jgi:hypothetical protein
MDMDMHSGTHTMAAMAGMGDAAEAEDEPAGHGMAMLGRKTVFLSHLPMFDSPHDYQVILEAQLTRAGADPQQVYFDDRQKHPDEPLYTLDPDPFVLTRILLAQGSGPKETSFVGSVFCRHFERFQTHPRKIASGVTVTVKNVVHGRRFIPDAPQPKNLEYILFGRGDELFLAHLITAPPDFDQLIGVTLDQNLPAHELLEGHRLIIPSRSNTVEDKISSAGGTVQGTLQLGESSLAVNITPGVEFYFEENELA